MHALEAEFYYWLARTDSIDTRCFENNWPYILQATRNGFFTHRTSDAIVYYTKRIQSDPLSKTVIVHALGNGRRKAMLAVVEQEIQQNIPVLLKNISLEEMAWWQEHGFVVPSEPWDEYSTYDDNTYPQYIRHVDHVLGLVYRRDQRKPIKRMIRERSIQTLPYENSFDQEAWKLLELFATHLNSKGAASYIEALRAHEFFFDDSIERRIRLQHVENGELVGCSYFTPVGSIAYYNALMNKSENNLQKFLSHDAKVWVAQHCPEITHIVDQGSETPGQDWMKMRSSTEKIVDKVHLQLSPSLVLSM